MATARTTKKTSTTTKTTKTTKKELSAFEKENIEVIKQINEYKQACEANVCAILYKNPDLLRESNLTLNDFNNNIWKVFFAIINDIIIVEKKNTIDDVIVGIYLEKHPQLKTKYDEYGGYEAVEKIQKYVKEKAFDGYLAELRKWSALIKMAKRGWVDKNRMSEYVDMTAEDIYNEHQKYINDIFINIDDEVKSYDICDGIDELIDELDEGLALGLPYYNLPIITKETGGQYLGSVTLVGGLSNVGKSTFARTATIPSIIEKNERIVIMLNEDGKKKWQRELLVWIANNILKEDLQKHVVRDGKYTVEVKQILKDSAKWLKEMTKNHVITVIPFKKYKTSKAIKVIKKYSSMGVKYFLLDTFKMDAGKVSEQAWLEMQQNMVEINDVVKPEANNLHILITFQLAKGSARQRFYTQDNVGMAKNIIDPVSTCIMIRDLYEDEYDGERKELKVYKLGGKNNKTKIPVRLSKDKHYQIAFIIKNREGAANQFQVVLEHDMSRNIMKEIGICNVPLDF